MRAVAVLFLAATLTGWIGDSLHAEVEECQPRAGLPHFLAKLAAGEETRVAYLGGSITEAEGWRPLTLRWFREQNPRARVVEINAAIAGTGSDFSVFRLRREVLDHDPDLLFVEFAVNDSGQPPERIVRAVEGIVRQTRRTHPQTDVCLVYTLSAAMLPDVQQGRLPASVGAMERVAEHYALPSVALGLEVARLEKEGRLVFTGPKGSAPEGKTVFSSDGIHPYPDTGHPFYLAAIQRALVLIRQASAATGAWPLPPPLDPANWEAACETPLRPGPGWKKLDPTEPRAAEVRAQTHDPAREVWMAQDAGASFTCRSDGTVFGFAGLKGPDSGQFSVSVDGGAPVTATLFDSFCVAGHYRIKPWFYPTPLAPGKHEATITFLGAFPDKARVLHLPHPEDAVAGEYAANRLYISDLLTLGPVEAPAK